MSSYSFFSSNLSIMSLPFLSKASSSISML